MKNIILFLIPSFRESYKMKAICFFLVLFTVLSAGAVELPLTNPAAPFVKKENLKQEKSKPVFDAMAKRILFGSKVIQIFPSGYLRITNAGKDFGDIYLYANTPYSAWTTNTNTQLVPPCGYKDGVALDSFTADEKTQTFTVKGRIPYHKKSAAELACHYVHKITLLPTNKVRIHLEYTLPEGAKRPATIVCNFKNAKSYKTPEKSGDFPAGKQQYNYRKPGAIRIFTGIEPDTCELKTLSDITAMINAKGMIILYANSDPKTPKHHVYDYELDLLNWSGKASFGAADMLETDALDPETPAARNLIQNPYFAQGLNHVGSFNQVYPHLGSGVIKLSKENPKFGENCLVADRAFSVQPTVISAEPGDYTFSWYARADHAAGASTSVYASNHAYKYILKEKSFKVGKEWQRYQVTVHVSSVTALRFHVEIKTWRKAPYKLYLDGFQLEKGKTATAFDCSPVTSCLLTSVPDDFIRSGDRINAKLRLSTLLDHASGKLDISVQDMFGTELYTKSANFKFNKNEHPVIHLELDGKIPDGVFKVKVTLDANGKKYTEYFRFSVMPFLQNKHKIKNLFAQEYNGGSCYVDVYPGYENYLRRSMYIGAGADTNQPKPTKALDALHAKYNFEFINTGIAERTWPNWIKIQFKGKGLKPQAGHTYYMFCWADDRYKLWNGNAGLLADHRLVGGWTEEHRKKIVETTEFLVRKSSPRRIYVTGSEWAGEIKNDPHYLDLLLAVREGVKKVYPNAMFCEGGSYNMDIGSGVREIDSTLARLKGKMPVEVVHTHTYTTDFLRLEPNFKALVNVVENKHGYKNMKYFFGEGMSYGPYEVPAWGLTSASWNGVNCWCTRSTISYDMGWTEKRSAAYYMRSWLIFLTKINQVISVCSSARNSSADIMDVQMRPRIYQKVPNTISLMLGNAKRFVKDVSFAQHTKCLIWEDEKGRPVAVVWYQDPLADQGLKQGPWASAQLPKGTEIYDMMGVKRTPRKDGRFPVSVFPFFFRGQPGQVDAFVRAFADAGIAGDAGDSFRAALELTSPENGTLILKNFKAGEISGTVTAGSKTVNVNLKPLGTAAVKIPYSMPLPYDRVASVSVPYTVKFGAKTVKKTDAFNGLAVKRFTGDWNRIPSFAIANSSKGKTASSDFSARGQLAWDKDNFYIRVTVTDDKFVHTEYPLADDRRNNDAMQIFIDTRCSARKTNGRTFDDDDYAYTFIFDKGKPKIFRRRSPDMQLTLGTAAPQDMTIAEDIPCKFTRTRTGYIYETAIPSRYMLPARLEPNYAAGFALYLTDRDSGEKVRQELTMTPAGTSPFNRPDLYPIIILTE